MNHHINAALVRERIADVNRRIEQAHRTGVRNDPRRLSPEPEERL